MFIFATKQNFSLSFFFAKKGSFVGQEYCDSIKCQQQRFCSFQGFIVSENSRQHNTMTGVPHVTDRQDSCAHVYCRGCLSCVLFSVELLELFLCFGIVDQKFIERNAGGLVSVNLLPKKKSVNNSNDTRTTIPIIITTTTKDTCTPSHNS